MEEKNYDVMDQNTLTVEITLAEYRYLLRRDLDSTMMQKYIKKKDDEIIGLTVGNNVLKRKVRDLKSMLACTRNACAAKDEE